MFCFVLAKRKKRRSASTFDAGFRHPMLDLDAWPSLTTESDRQMFDTELEPFPPLQVGDLDDPTSGSRGIPSGMINSDDL